MTPCMVCNDPVPPLPYGGRAMLCGDACRAARKRERERRYYEQDRAKYHAAERAARARQAGMSISAPSSEAVKTDTPPQDTHANLARLVTQLRDERDALASELFDLRARWRVMAREMHLLGAQWDKQSPTTEA